MAEKAKRTQKAQNQNQPAISTVVAELQDAPSIVHEAHGPLLYDLAVVVGASYQMVIEPTQAGKVPKRLAAKIYPLLHGSRPSYYEDSDVYLEMVFAIAEQLDLLQLRTSIGQKARYQPGSELAGWAALPPSEQVRLLLGFWSSPNNHIWSDVAGINYRPGSFSFSYYMDMAAAREGLMDYLSDHCQPGQWYSLTAFLQNAKAVNPMLLRERSRYPSYNSVQTRKEILATWEQNDGEIISGMLASSLHELGLVALGFQEDKSGEEDTPTNPDAFCFSELAAQVMWDKPTADAPERPRTLIVQPNFELLLLQPDYNTLYQLLPFAKVDQVEMVSRLTLTQESVRRGVEAGWGVERTIKTLQEHSQKELPQNVLYTLQDWSKLYKDSTISQVILVEVSSEASADELCASPRLRALDLRRLGPCAIAVGSQVSLQVLRTALEKEGLILHIQGDIVSVREASSASSQYHGYGRRR